MAVLVLAIGVALVFDITNGFHDSANAVAALVATRAARPLQAVVLAGVFHVAGPLLAGKAVADTVSGIVLLPSNEVLSAVGASLTGALCCNIIKMWRGMTSS